MNLSISLTHDAGMLKQCALLMCQSEPWKTLKRDFNGCMEAFQGEYKEIYVATAGGSISGFAILQMAGSFKGYIQTICVSPEHRGKGIGSAILTFCEERIFRESPNVFMCVSSFNTEAAKLYYRLGYVQVGELLNFIVQGYSEILLRKTTGPLAEFRTKEER